MSLLLNASNLHVGGGVQVATSVVEEVLMASKALSGVSIAVSSEVSSNLVRIPHERHVHVKNIDVHGFDFFNFGVRRELDMHKRVFTMFGPLYRWRPKFRNIVGFAQPWIIYPNNECYAAMPFVKRIRTKFKYWIQSQFFKRADILVVELEHVKNGLVRELGIAPELIYVVHNCLSAIYRDDTKWLPVEVAFTEGAVRLGFVGRNYLHKNTGIFPDIVSSLRVRHGIEAVFCVTFSELEWQACTPEFRKTCINVGPLSVAQCPNFYKSLDAVVFPSLLECFSATPLEAMAMEKPLFASDRQFNRDICGTHASYFDPASPESAADAIAQMLQGGGPDAAAIQAAKEHAFNFSSPSERAKKYLDILASG